MIVLDDEFWRCFYSRIFYDLDVVYDTGVLVGFILGFYLMIWGMFLCCIYLSYIILVFKRTLNLSKLLKFNKL